MYQQNRNRKSSNSREIPKSWLWLWLVSDKMYVYNEMQQRNTHKKSYWHFGKAIAKKIVNEHRTITWWFIFGVYFLLLIFNTNLSEIHGYILAKYVARFIYLHKQNITQLACVMMKNPNMKCTIRCVRSLLGFLYNSIQFQNSRWTLVGIS